MAKAPKTTKKKSDKPAEQPNYDEIKKTLVEQAKKDGHIAQRDIIAVIPDTAEILISLRSFDTMVRDNAIAAIRRIAAGPPAAPPSR